MSENAPDVLDLLMRHELAVKKLYEAFAALFPDRQGFWRQIASEEANHAHWLEALGSEPAFKSWFRLDSRLKPRAIESSISYVDAQAVKAHQGQFTLLEALSVSADLENAILEKQFARMQGAAPSRVRSILTDLTAETERHRAALIDALDAEKRQLR